MTTDAASRAALGTGPTLMIAVALAVVATWFGGPPLPIAARPCAGVGELLTAAAAYLAPHLTPGFWIAVLARASAVASALLVAAVVRRTSGSAVAAVAAAAAVAMSAPLAARLDPAQPAAACVAALCLAAVLRPTGTARRPLAVGVLCGATALVLPPLAVPLGVVAAAAVGVAPGDRRRRAWQAVGALAAPPALAAAVVWLSPDADQTAACVLPRSWSLEALVANLGRVALSFGPYAVALAVLGLAAAVVRPGDVWRKAVPLAGAYALSALVAPAWSDDTSWAAMMPAIVLGWMAAGRGLQQVMALCAPGPGGRLAALLLAALMPTLQLSTWRDEPLARARLDGQQTLTGDRVATLLGALPPGSPLHREDAVTDTLVAMQLAWRAVAPGTALTVVDALQPARRVMFGLPAAARRLQRRGFLPQTTTMAGLTRLEWRGGCTAIDEGWRDVPELQSAASLAAVAIRPEQRGPMVIYLQFETPSDVRPREWASVELRGFHLATFDPVDPDSRRQLDDQAAADGLTLVLDSTARQVVRLEMYRTPVSADTLLVDLGGRPHRVHARVTAGAVPPAFTLCAAYPDPDPGPLGTDPIGP